MSTCDVFNCLFTLDVQNEIQLLSGVLYSPRNDPDPEMIPNPEMIPIFLLVDPEMIPQGIMEW